MKEKIYSERFVKYYDIFKKDEIFKKEALYLHNLMRGCKTILDIGCGTGKHAKFLKNLGHDIEGIDYSPEMISYAKKHVKGIKFHVGDASTFNLHKKFDCIIAWDSVLTYLRKNKFRQAVKNITKHLDKGGKFIFHIAFTDKLVGKPFESGDQQSGQERGIQLTRVFKMKRIGNLLWTEIIVSGIDKDKKVCFTEQHVHTILKTAEILNLLKKLGYNVKTRGNNTKGGWNSLQVIATKRRR